MTVDGDIIFNSSKIFLYGNDEAESYLEVKGDIIFDSHLGSAPSRIACYKLGFDFYGCEIDADYYKLADERFKRECLGEYTMKDGRTAIQLDIFGSHYTNNE